jgi:pyrimidine operon attenuation protein/uracil phosphoribosyltransferase
MEKKHILTGAQASMKLRRMAFEILENNLGEAHLVLVGIRDSGYTVARRLQLLLAEISPVRVSLFPMTIDKRRPAGAAIDPMPDVDGEVVILVDDVANSGRTLLYALKPFLDRYPKKIQTLVLVERSHKTYPIHPDYVGHRLATTLSENVVVEVEGDDILGAYLH